MKEIIFMGQTFEFQLEADRAMLGEGADGLTAFFYRLGKPDEVVKPIVSIKLKRTSPDYDRFKAAVEFWQMAA